jgi:hypothetical protein
MKVLMHALAARSFVRGLEIRLNTPLKIYYVSSIETLCVYTITEWFIAVAY